jgi:tetratricopeptide (TPR) repeat protein
MVKETVDSLCKKAQHALAQGETELARTFYQQALGLRSDDPDVHYGMATVCFLLNDLPTSAYHFKEVTRLDPLRAGAYINLGAVYNRLEQFDDAIPVLRKGIQLDVTRAEGYYNLGLVYRRKQRNDLAIQAYREAVRVNPRMADAHYNIANIYLEKGQYALSIAHYKQSLELRPRWDKALRGIEAAQEAMGGGGDSEVAANETAPDLKSPVAAARAKALDPERLVDPNLHGEMLRNLHRATIETEEQGRALLASIEKRVEPAIKELSSVLLYANTPISQLSEHIRQFEEAIAMMRSLQKAIKGSVEKVNQFSEQLLST